MESGKGEGVGKTWQMKEVSAHILGRGLRACKTQGRHQPGAQLDMQQVLGSLCAAPVSLCSRSHPACHPLHLCGPPLLHHLLLLWPLPEEAAATETLQLPGEHSHPPTLFFHSTASPSHLLWESDIAPGCPRPKLGPQTMISSRPPSPQMSDQSEGAFNDVERSSVSSTPNSNVSTPPQP